MTDDSNPDPDELQARIDQLEQTVEQMLPSRRDLLQMGGGAALGAGLLGATTGGASAGTASTGTIGTTSDPVDLVAEDFTDHNGNDVMELPGDGSVSIEQADVTDETFIQASRSTAASSVTSGSWTNIVDSEDIDSTGEFGSAKFMPANAGWYVVSGVADINPGSSGDLVQIRVQDVGGNTTIQEIWSEQVAGNSEFHYLNFALPVEFGTNTYEVQIRDNDSSYDVRANQTTLTIYKSVVHP